ncbi:MAG: hypothetical protein JRC87_05335 [Deltaproteobacteria bacterium]|nr:hypothetical protein [Deltaproteobacteria bacterium]MBW2659013.1 hypothetical protein [Deltaproteobacteria bacterium]
MKTSLNKNYDLRGVEISRLGKTALFAKIIPVGNLRGGPGIRCLIVLTVLHYFGGVLYWADARYGHRLEPGRRLLSKFRQK